MLNQGEERFRHHKHHYHYKQRLFSSMLTPVTHYERERVITHCVVCLHGSKQRVGIVS